MSDTSSIQIIRPGRRDWLTLLALGLIGGGTFLGVEIALQGLAPLWLAALRISIGGATVAAIWLVQGLRLFDSRPGPAILPRLLAVALLSTVIPFSLVSWGQQHVTSGFASVAMASSALIVSPLAHVFVPGERLTPRRVWGLTVGFGGVVMLIGPSVLAVHADANAVLGQLACLGAATCYAVCSIIVKRLPKANPVGLVAVTLLTGSALILPAAFVMHGWPGPVALPALGAVVGLALVSTAGSNLLGMMLIRSAGPTFMALTNYLTPMFAMTLGALVLAEEITPQITLGFILIVSGLAIAQGRRGPSRPRPRRDAPRGAMSQAPISSNL